MMKLDPELEIIERQGCVIIVEFIPQKHLSKSQKSSLQSWGWSQTSAAHIWQWRPDHKDNPLSSPLKHLPVRMDLDGCVITQLITS